MTNVDQAFEDIDRSVFLPPSKRQCSGFDTPIPIGYGQTNSQPTTVRMMLQWLGPELGEKIFDIGSGSGWTTALLSRIVGELGEVYAVERVPELVRQGAENCQRAGITNARFFEASASQVGLPDFAPYDRILVSAAANDLPDGLLDQLKDGGRLVIPIKSSIHVITKESKDSFKTVEYGGFAFVPLIT